MASTRRTHRSCHTTKFPKK